MELYRNWLDLWYTIFKDLFRGFQIFFISKSFRYDILVLMLKIIRVESQTKNVSAKSKIQNKLGQRQSQTPFSSTFLDQKDFWSKKVLGSKHFSLRCNKFWVQKISDYLFDL